MTCRIHIALTLAALALAGCSDGHWTSGSGGSGTSGGAGGTDAGAAGAGAAGSGGTSTTASTTTTTTTQGGGSGGSCPSVDDANPCTDDGVGADGCSPTHTPKADADLCSVEAQYGRCLAGNCLVGLLDVPACGAKGSAPSPGAWVAAFYPVEVGKRSLAGAAAVVPLSGCASAKRRYRLSVPVALGGPQSASPEGVALAKEMTVDPAAAWPADELPWIGGRKDVNEDVAAGYGVWVEAEVPPGACAGTCGDAGATASFTCSGENGGALTGCAASPTSFLLAPLGF